MPDGSAHNGHASLSTPAGIAEDLLGKHSAAGSKFRGVAIICAVLLGLGIVGFVLRLGSGVSDPSVWGYHAALFAFILTTAQAAPLVAIVLRLTKGHWRRPTSRAAELFAVVGLLNVLIFIPLLWVLPSLEDGRRSLWFFGEIDGVSAYSPHIWSTIALLLLVLCGMMLLWVSALPDLAEIRDRSTGRLQRVFARLANGWHGTSRQWHMQHHRLGILGAFYFMMLVFVHFLISVDFAMALVPGWIDALFPATQAANSLQAGVAAVIVVLYLMRRFGGYGEYIGLDQFWALGKLLFALSLLWFWFWFSSFNVLWYGAKPGERAVIDLFMVGSYRPAFIAVFLLNFVIPLFVMVWNPVRKSILGPTLIASGVLVGTFLDRIRLYVGSFSIPGIGDPTFDKHVLHGVPPAVLPGVPDVLIWVGGIAGVVLFYMLATRVIPPMNIWEHKELLLYKVHKRFHRTEVLVLAKPE